MPLPIPAFLRAVALSTPEPLVVSIVTSGVGEDDELLDLVLTKVDGSKIYEAHLAPATAAGRAADDWAKLWRDAGPLMQGRWLIAYCAERTRRLIEQTGARRGGRPIWIPARWVCIEDVLAPHFGTGPDAAAEARNHYKVQGPSPTADATERARVAGTMFSRVATLGLPE